MARYDRHADVQASPTLADVAETLGISTAEAERLLVEHRVAQAVAQSVAQQSTPLYSAKVGPYEQTFRQFDAEGGTYIPTWNWSAFLFGGLWYLAKGLWGKAFLYIVSSWLLIALTGGLAGVLIPIFIGMMANYDYYLLERRGTQFWEGAQFRRSARQPITPPVIQIVTTSPGPTAHTPPVAHSTADPLESRYQILQETYGKGLLTPEEYELKRRMLLNELEQQDKLKKLIEARDCGLLTSEEYETKRTAVLQAAPPSRFDLDF